MNTQFWIAYLTDYHRFILKAAFLLVALIICRCFTKNKGTFLALTLGYILADPFSYYFIDYHLK